MTEQPQLPTPREGLIWVRPSNGATVTNPAHEPSAKQRHYFGSDLDRALRAWGKLNGRPGALADAQRIVNDVVAAEHSPIYEVFFPPSKQYVTIVLEKDRSRGSAFVNVGFVHFRCDLPGSLLDNEESPEAAGPLRRLDLPTAGGSSDRTKRPVEIHREMCPECHMTKALNGSCYCG